MILEFCTPAGTLLRDVELITFYEGYVPGHRIEKILPEGVVEVIVDLTEIEKYIYDNVRLETIQSCKFAWISGLCRESTWETPPLSVDWRQAGVSTPWYPTVYG